MLVDEIHTEPGIHVERTEPSIVTMGTGDLNLDFCSWRCVAAYAASREEPLMPELEEVR